MTISWGPWSQDRIQAGVEVTYSPTSITTGTASVTVTTRVYLRSRYASNETGSSTTWWITGSVTNGSGNTDWNVGAMGYVQMGSTTQTVTLNYGSSQTRSGTGRVHSYYAHPGADSSVTQTITIPARPYSAPAVQTGVTATRNSDTQATIAWVHHGTSAAPYTSQDLDMQTFTGTAWGAWVRVATGISATATSYVKTGLSANHAYAFRLRANNTAGSSGYSTPAPSVQMTPGVPSTATAAVATSGTTITVSWQNATYTGSGTVTNEIQRSVNGGAFANVVTGITASQSAQTWTDPTPGAGTNQYRVATRQSVGSLLSAYKTTNSVATIVPPLAPTTLSPNGAAVDLTGSVTLTWKHNPGGDNAPQSHLRIQYSTTGGVSWTTLPGADGIASTVSSFTVPGGTLANGTNYQWHVQTQGNTTVGYGPYSSAATLIGSAKPVATIDAAHPAATTVTLPLDLTWAYAQDQGSPQAAWTAYLYAADGATILETVSGTTENTVVWTYAVADQTTYVVGVKVKSGAGLWSDLVTKTTAINLPPPAPITLSADFNPCTGRVVLQMTPTAPGVGQVAADYAYVERRIDGGDWVVVTPQVAVPNAILDPLPTTNGLNEYRVTGISTTPSYSVNPILQVPTSDGATGGTFRIHVSWGDAFQQMLHLQGDPKTKSTAGRERVGARFLRTKPVLLLGDAQSYAVNVSGTIRFTADCGTADVCGFDPAASEFERAGRESGMVCYRDYTGRRFFGYLSDMDVDDLQPGMAAVAFTATESEFSEGYLGSAVS